MSEDYFSADMGSLFAQESPNGTMNFLGCHDVGDIVEPQGDITKRYCQKADGTGHEVALTTRAIPGDVTTTITTYIGKTADYLRELKRTKCKFALYVNQALCGRRDDALEYDNGTLLKNCLIVNHTKTNTNTREGTDAAEQTFDIVADNPADDYYKLTMTRQTTTEGEDLLDISACGGTHCAGVCGDASEHCDFLVAVAEADAAATANVLFSYDGGTTWTAGTVDPFVVNAMNISSVVCFPMGRDTTRVIVARGTTDAGPCDIAITDNGGAAWTSVAVGAVNTEFVPWGGGLFALDEYHIWCVTDTGGGAAGNIYFSDDGGNTWTDMGGGGDALNYVDFMDYNHGLVVGDTNEILYTDDAGTTWTTITGPAAQNAVDCLCCSVITESRWFVGYEDGELWFTEDGGDNWTQRVFAFPAGAASVNRVNDIKFLDDGYHGVMGIKWTDGAAALWGSILRTFNGGMDWEVYDTAAAYTVGATGMNAVEICHPNLSYGVGDLCTATGTIYQASA